MCIGMFMGMHMIRVVNVHINVNRNEYGSVNDIVHDTCVRTCREMCLGM